MCHPRVTPPCSPPPLNVPPAVSASLHPGPRTSPKAAPRPAPGPPPHTPSLYPTPALCMPSPRVSGSAVIMLWCRLSLSSCLMGEGGVLAQTLKLPAQGEGGCKFRVP